MPNELFRQRIDEIDKDLSNFDNPVGTELDKFSLSSSIPHPGATSRVVKKIGACVNEKSSLPLQNPAKWKREQKLNDTSNFSMEAVIGHKQSHLLENNHLELYTYQK